jgi:hypothetical protein
MVGDAGRDAEVVLAIVYGVGDAGVDPVDFAEGQAEAVTEGHRDSAAAEEAEGVAVDGELEVDVLFGSADEDLRVGDEALGAAERVAGAEEIVEDGDVLQAVVHIGGVSDHEVGDACPGGGDVVDDGSAASVEGEAAALAGRRVGVKVVVVRAEFEPGHVATARRDRLSAKSPGESEYEYQKCDGAKMRHSFLSY